MRREEEVIRQRGARMTRKREKQKDRWVAERNSTRLYGIRNFGRGWWRTIDEMIRGYLRSANRARSLGQFAPLENRAFCQVHPPNRTQKLHSGQSRGKLDWVFMFASDFNTGSSVHMWCQVTIRTLVFPVAWNKVRGRTSGRWRNRASWWKRWGGIETAAPGEVY